MHISIHYILKNNELKKMKYYGRIWESHGVKKSLKKTETDFMPISLQLVTVSLKKWRENVAVYCKKKWT